MLYQFGPYRLDSSDRQLWREGSPVQLTPKSFELLLVLVESGGKLLRKQDLIDKVWPGTFVEESNLAQNIATIRKALGDQDHHLILTVPKHGYRFVPPVVHHLPSAPETPTDSHVPRGNLRRALFVLAFALAPALCWKLLFRELPAGKPQPITSMPGMEVHPTLSPDGRQVAFGWIGAERRAQIYVSGITADPPPARLTTSESVEVHPSWSPDGRLIAFIRNPGEEGEIHVVPPAGGATRKVADTRDRVLAWWPDSQSVVLASREAANQPSSLFRISIADGARTKITFPSEGVGDVGVAFSPDGGRMAVTRWSSGGQYEILVGGKDNTALRTVVSHSMPIYGVAWSPNGADLIFSATRESVPKLWRIAASATSGTRPEGIDNIEAAALFPTMFRSHGSKTGRLVYSQLHQDVNIRRWSLPVDPSVNRATIEIAPSTRLDLDPAFSPDAERIAFASDRSGSSEIWVCRGDGSNPNQLTRFGIGMAGSPRWSADGKKIAFDYSRDGRSSIHSMNEDGSGLTRLPTGEYQAARPSWSTDSRSIYFQCAGSAGRQICRIPVNGGGPVQITERGGAEAHQSKDGRYVYFVKSVDQPGLWKIPVEGGTETLVHREVWQGYWGIAADSIYYIRMGNVLAPYTLRSLDLQTGHSRDIATIVNPVIPSTPGFSITADGRSMLLIQVDKRDSDLMLIDNFR